MKEKRIIIEDIGFARKMSDGITEVLPQRIFGFIAIICLAMTLALVLLVEQKAIGFGFNERIYFFVLMSLLALPLLLFSFVVRYYVDSEKIVFRTMLGYKKTLIWKDIKTVKLGMNPTKIKLCGDKSKIKIYPVQYFGIGSEYLITIIQKYCRDANWI